MQTRQNWKICARYKLFLKNPTYLHLFFKLKSEYVICGPNNFVHINCARLRLCAGSERLIQFMLFPFFFCELYKEHRRRNTREIFMYFSVFKKHWTTEAQSKWTTTTTERRRKKKCKINEHKNLFCINKYGKWIYTKCKIYWRLRVAKCSELLSGSRPQQSQSRQMYIIVNWLCDWCGIFGGEWIPSS